MLFPLLKLISTLVIVGQVFIGIDKCHKGSVLILQVLQTFPIKVSLSDPVSISFDLKSIGFFVDRLVRQLSFHESMIVPFFDMHSQFPILVEDFGRAGNGSWIDGNDQIPEWQNVIMIRHPFDETMVVIHDQQTRTKCVVTVG